MAKSNQEELANATDASDFSQLTYLLELITSLNADAHCEPSFHRVVVAHNDATEEISVLDSIAAILVQNTEIMAACYTSDKVSVIAAENEIIPASDIDVDVDVTVDVDVDDHDHVPVQSESSSHKFCRPLRLAAISNPDNSRNLDASKPDARKPDASEPERNLHNVRIDNKGENLWQKVQDSHGWYFVFMWVLYVFDLYVVLTLTDMIRGARPLRDHVATVSGYLNHYKSETNSQFQGVHSQDFTNYLLSTCWRKITRKIKSWEAHGYIFLTKLINPVVLNKYVRKWNDTDAATVGPGDRTLAKFLKSLDTDKKQGLIFDYIRDYDSDFTQEEPHHDDSPDVLPLIFNNVNSASLGPIFSKETALEFHKLTIAAFRGFQTIFLRIQETDKKLVSIDY